MQGVAPDRGRELLGVARQGYKEKNPVQTTDSLKKPFNLHEVRGGIG